jgi:signal transduction histidine kinase
MSGSAGTGNNRFRLVSSTVRGPGVVDPATLYLQIRTGINPTQLATLTLKLDAARNLLSQEPQSADAPLAEFKSQTRAAISYTRRLVYDLRRPALGELGLMPAIREQITSYGQNGLNVSAEAPEQLPPLRLPPSRWPPTASSKRR